MRQLSLMWEFLNPFTPSNRQQLILTIYHQHEKAKRRNYEQRVKEIDHGSFISIVLSATGGIGEAAETTTYKWLAFHIGYKTRTIQLYCGLALFQNKVLNLMISWSGANLLLIMMRSAVMYLCSSRSISHQTNSLSDINFNLTLSEGKIIQLIV